MKFISSIFPTAKPVYSTSMPTECAMDIQHSKNKMTLSFGLSICIHAALICLTIYLTSLIEPAQQLMVIDFSILEQTAAVNKKPVNPALKPINRDLLDKPKPNKKTAVIEKKPPIVKPAPKPIIKPRVISRITPKKILPKPIGKVEIPKTKPVQAKIEQPDPTPVAQTIESQKPPEPFSPPYNSTPAPVTANNSNGSLPQVSEKSSGSIPNYAKVNFQYIRKGIQKLIRYPKIARKMGWEGKVVVEFIVTQNGQVTDIHIVESSGFSALDKNAVATIKKAAPFPPPSFPAKLIVPVVYRLS